MNEDRQTRIGQDDRLEPEQRAEFNRTTAQRSATDWLVELLTTRVRLLSLEQVTTLFFQHAKDPPVIARKHLHRMKHDGLVSLKSVMTPKSIEMRAPLLDWHPGDGEPDLDHLSWLAEKRLAAVPASTLIVHATRKAQAQTLGPIGSRAPRSQEITHDLLVSSVFARLWNDSPEQAATWRPEDALLQDLVREQGSFASATIPDAVIRCRGEDIAIEVVGRYSPQKLAAIHAAHCDGRYQLW